MNDVVRVQYIRQPAFYKDFHCTGGDCLNSCCIGWNIGWTEEEYTKLKSAKVSDELEKVINSSFKEQSNEAFKKKFKYQISLGEGGKCPFLNNDGLCMIQKELGTEYLSHTCRIYPRKGHICGNALIQTCHF